MNVEDRDSCYEIFRSKDARYDGRFFVGITSTGIYCRPVCRARLPKPENCRYFLTAAAAEKAGFRPCLLCRPERAPGTSRVDALSELARRAAYYLRDNCDEGLSLKDLASEMGCSERHLRRVFQKEYHVTPVEYLQTCRLLMARQLLTQTSQKIVDIAMTAGFGSLRRMNELFRSRYGMTPSEIRRKAGCADTRDVVTVFLGYRPPYAWKEILAFLGPRAVPHVERVEEDTYERVLRFRTRGGEICSGVIRVMQDEVKQALKVEMSETLVPVMPRVLAGVRQMFDLDCDPQIIEKRLDSLRDYLPGGAVPGIRLPGCFDAFEMACRAVLGQQITVRAASTLCGRLAQECGTPADTGVGGLDRTFPQPQSIVEMGEDVTRRLGEMGIIATRSRAIWLLAAALSEQDGIRLTRAGDPEREIMRLQKIRGIGEWTAKYIVMRTMGWTDAFLETDSGIRRMLPGMSDSQRLQLSLAWKPWRSYAMMNLWNEQGLKAERN